MKHHILVAMAAAAILVAAPAGAQSRKAGAKAPAQITLVNARSAALTGLSLTDEAGKQVGSLKVAVAAGKKASIAIAKGTGCAINVAASFDDEGYIEASQVNVCKDKTIRLTD